jgi:amidase
MAGELWSMGATELAAAIRGKKASSREVVEAHLARIAQVNPAVNAVTVVLADAALATADAADRAVAAGEPLGPLHGVPFTVKENIDLAGSATTQGLKALADAMPPLDAPQVAAIKAAGGIAIGRTNLPDFGLRWHTDNELRGATTNPWDATRTPGGSSGGEAAALATGMTPLGMGNDYGGSLRWPAQCNGIVSLKPSYGRIAQAGSIPPLEGPVTIQLFAVEGPMARRVADLELALQAMTGPSARDPRYAPAPLRGPAVARRVAVVADPGGAGVDPAVAAGVRRAAGALSEAGYAVEEVDAPMVREAVDTWAQLVIGEVALGFLPQLGPLLGADAKRFLELAIDAVGVADYGAYMTGFIARQAAMNAWSGFLDEFPVVLGPVGTIQPFPVGHDLKGKPEVLEILEGLRLVVALNLMGLPAVVVPVGEARGLPQSVQVIGRWYREDVCLEAAQAIEDRLGTIAPIDPR